MSLAGETLLSHTNIINSHPPQTSKTIATKEKCHRDAIRAVRMINPSQPKDANAAGGGAGAGALTGPCFITGGWDRQIKMWDARSMSNTATNALTNAKVFCMDVNGDKHCVVGGSDKKIHVFDYRNGLARLLEKESEEC